MSTLHAKSLCCQEKIYRYGNRRRICNCCGKTWRIRRKKRGQKSSRDSPILLREILSEGVRVDQWARRHRITVSATSQRLHKALKQFVKRSASVSLPLGPHVLLGDGLWFHFTKQNWVLFLLALKPVWENRAYFLEPIILPGGESYENWQVALKTIPLSLKNQIKAFVSDGFRCAEKITAKNGWIHQRCHFHLIAYLQVRRGRRKKQVMGRNTREEIYQTILNLLRVQDLATTTKLIDHLKLIAKRSDCPRSMQMIVSEFLRSINAFRAYLQYPELNLPTTTGSIETMCNLVRKRTRAIRTSKALILWAKTLVRLKSPITCNGKNFQPN